MKGTMKRSNQERILVVDDDPGLLQLLKMRLIAMGFAVTPCTSGQEAISEAQQSVFDLAIIDLRLAAEDGLAVMDELLLIHPHLPVLILTGHGSIPNAVEAMQKGAYAYLTKPVDTEEFRIQIEKALMQQRMSREIQRLQLLVKELYGMDKVIARSAKMQILLQQVALVAQTNSTVCLYGETGTGKEVIARVIHANSRRAKGPFVAVNCAAIPEALFESQLFGHVRGAFTGAIASKQGFFQAAHGGTLFLDEVGEMSLPMQAKLLRAIQEREVWAVGAECPTKVDVRIIAATNKDLGQAVQVGSFREDLFYRIQVVPLTVPPLRERRDDIPVLAHHFLQQSVRLTNKEIHGFLPDAMQKLMLYSWPGNIRELENVIEAAVVMSRDNMITAEVLPSLQRSEKSELKPLNEARVAFERAYLKEALETAQGDLSRACEIAGYEKAEFCALLKRYGLQPDQKPPQGKDRTQSGERPALRT